MAKETRQTPWEKIEDLLGVEADRSVSRWQDPVTVKLPGSMRNPLERLAEDLDSRGVAEALGHLMFPGQLLVKAAQEGFALSFTNPEGTQVMSFTNEEVRKMLGLPITHKVHDSGLPAFKARLSGAHQA